MCIQPSYKKETLWLFGQATVPVHVWYTRGNVSKQSEEAEENFCVLMEVMWLAVKLCIQETISY